MSQIFKRVLLALAVVGAAGSTFAFSLLGPFDASYQTPALGYNQLNTDIGGPMNIGQEYRWNTRTITYGFDPSFINSFGPQGQAAVQQAVAILNNLPAASQMSSNLTEFPLNSKRINYLANALGLRDVKSTAMHLLLEEMGLASPERYVWTLRDRQTLNNGTLTNYLVMMRNFDPITYQKKNYINGVLYTFTAEDVLLYPSGYFSDAGPTPVDPLAFTLTTVAAGGLNYGEFFTGLTRDDVGGLRYLFSTNNYNVENLIPGTTLASSYGSGGGSGGCPSCPWDAGGGGVATNGTVTFTVVDQAWHSGVDKITFQYVQYDPFYFQYTNSTTDWYKTNYYGTPNSQSVQRVQTQPDILFTAGDLGLVYGVPIPTSRTVTTGWANNSALNSQPAAPGPGVIRPQVTITFNNMGPYFIGNAPSWLDQANATPGFVWASFDGTTNDPVLYGISLQDWESILGF